MNPADRWDAAVGEGEQQVPAGRRHVGQGGARATSCPPPRPVMASWMYRARRRYGWVIAAGRSRDMATISRSSGVVRVMEPPWPTVLGAAVTAGRGPREQVGRAEDFHVELVVEAAGTAATAGGEDAPVGNQHRHRVVAAAVNPHDARSRRRCKPSECIKQPRLADACWSVDMQHREQRFGRLERARCQKSMVLVTSRSGRPCEGLRCAVVPCLPLLGCLWSGRSSTWRCATSSS
jgi:hypothetical protein